MWLLLFFDLPTHTVRHRKAYRVFKKALKRLLFHRLQYSVYARYTADSQDSIIENVCSIAPEEGDVKLIAIPNHAYEKRIHLQNGCQQPNNYWKRGTLFW